jgi:hypothetical protein
MALHRDIYWVGRQWAVTGFGIQAIDQRLKGSFDIEGPGVWDDVTVERTRGLAWLNAADFDRALELARARHPEPPRKKLPLVESVLEMIQPAAAEPEKMVSLPLAAETRAEQPAPMAPLPVRVDPVMAVRTAQVSAKFLQTWRVR